MTDTSAELVSPISPLPATGSVTDPPAGTLHETRALWLVAAAFVVVELAVSWRYGFHRDELYFLAAARRPALGYVDQPPLAPLLTRVGTFVFGVSPSAIRVVPALAGGGVVLLAGLTARALGGQRAAQLLAALAVAYAPVTLAAAHLANTTIYDLLAWSAIVLLVMLAVNERRRPLWVAVGVVAGLGLENKDLPLLLLGALFIGLLVTGRRRELANPWVAIGATAALTLWLPNLIWQGSHHWPQLAMSRALHREHSTGSDYAAVLPAELLYIGFAAVPLAVVGIRRLARVGRLRCLVVAVIVVLTFVVVWTPGRPYYADGLMPVVLAAGAVGVEQSRRRIARWTASLIVWFALTLVIVLPVLPVSVLGHLSFMHKLNYDQGETVGWPQLTATVSRVYNSLPAARRSEASIFTANYGEAGALALYGPRTGLPVPLSGHNTYWLWGPGHAPDQTVIAVGAAPQLRPYFRSCAPSATFHSPDNVNNDETGVVIAICSGPRRSWSALWRYLQHYD